MERTTRCPEKTRTLLKKSFKAVSGAAIDTKLSMLQEVSLERGEKILNYSNRIVKLESELEGAGHSIADLEKKKILLRGIPHKFYVTAETTVNSVYSYHDLISKLILRETRIVHSEKNTAKPLFMRRGTRNCYI